MSLADLRAAEYVARVAASTLRRQVFGQADPVAAGDLLDALQRAEEKLSAVEQQRAEAQAAEPATDGLILDTGRSTLGEVSFDADGRPRSGLQARAVLRMAQVPTSIHHLLDRTENPLVTFTIRNAGEDTRRLRVTSFVEGYSARAVDTVQLPAGEEISLDQLPTFFPDRLQGLSELTGATMNVLVEDLDSGVELHQTERVRLLARTVAPMRVLDPADGRWRDLSRYLAAFVTPNTPTIMTFLRRVAEHHADNRLIGYQGSRDGVTSQVKAIFAALKATGMTYVNSVIAFSPEEGTATQRIRLPRESLADQEANCIDGTVLVASLLEAISMNPAIVIVPGHAFVAWESWQGSGEWHHLETTMIDSASFEEACAEADRTAERYRRLREQTRDPLRFRLWSLQELRSVHRITPME